MINFLLTFTLFLFGVISIIEGMTEDRFFYFFIGCCCIGLGVVTIPYLIKF